MKADTFTKIALTVIAVNLTILTVKNLGVVPKAYAEEPANPEIVPGTNYGLVPLNEDGSINVRLANSQTVDVNISGIDRYVKMDVNLKEVDHYAFLHCTVPVSVE